ncbi:MAG: DUF6384 family protein, partial [Nanoarchaeota archaeon]
LRQQREEVKRQLNIEDSKNDLKRRILETSKVTGEELKEEDIDRAISLYLSGLYQFKGAESPTEENFAELYIDRKRIGKRYGIPLLFLAGGFIAYNLISDAVVAARSKFKERSIESEIEKGYQIRQQLSSDIATASHSPITELLDQSDKQTLENTMLNAELTLKGTDEFFLVFCSDGTSSDNITRKNYQEAQQQFRPIESVLDSVVTSIRSSNELLNRQEQMFSAQKSLDSLILEIENSNPPQVLMERAKLIYENGITSLRNKQVEKGLEYRKNLEDLSTDVKELSVLPAQLNQLYSSIKSVAEEREAIDQADKINQEAQTYLKTADVKNLKQTIQRLSEIDSILKQDYKITIINRQDLKSGIDRYYTDENGKRSSGYYLIVEAKDKSGRVMSILIENEEDGKTYKVDMWGERVPEEVYEAVKEDKIDNGIINDDEFGLKRRGYINPEITMKIGGVFRKKPIERAGQITNW